jgi:nitroimidazol reductase NimA-like FMN-containing flavoprotein (pyridoxamine 5'-phosphate oxidase superfamily)
MVHELDPQAIDAFLYAQLFARIAYLDLRGRPNIAPIAYAYDGAAFYGYSLLGGKIEGMSSNPMVCIEVDRVSDAANWCSVVAYGVFELLRGSDVFDAVRRVSERMKTVARAQGGAEAAAQTYVAREGGAGYAYRIRLTEKHGRQSAAS